MSNNFIGNLPDALLKTSDIFTDFIVDGMQWAVPSPASLTSNMSAGTAWLNGIRTNVDAIGSYGFPASNDTYISFNNAGIPAYQSVANGAAVPTPTNGYVQTHKVITNATSVVSVEILFPLLNLLYNHTYTIESTLYTGSVPYIKGKGPSTVFSASAGIGDIITGNSTGACILEDFTIDANFPSSGTALKIQSAGNVVGLNINNAYNGMGLYRSTYLRGNNVYYFTNNGLTLNGASDTAISQHTNFASTLNASGVGNNLVMNGNCQGVIISDSEFIGGGSGLTVTPVSSALPVTAYSNGPAFNRFTNVFFDSSNNGALIDWSMDTIFNACWFSNRPGNGATVGQNFTSGIQFIGSTFENSGSHGLEIASGAVNTSVIGCLIKGNNTENNGSYGIYIANNTKGFIISKNTITSLLGGTGHQQVAAIYIGTGCDDYIIEGNYLLGNEATIIDNSRTTAQNRVVRNNIGYDEYNGIIENTLSAVFNTTSVLTETQAGSLIVWNGTSPGSLTLPLAGSAQTISMKFVITNGGSSPVTVVTQGGDFIDLSTNIIYPGQQVALVNSTNNIWRTIWQTNRDPTFFPINFSGSNLTTTGSITSGSSILTLSGPIDFENLQGIIVAGAASGGADLITQILDGAGTTNLTISTPASVSVSLATIYHDDTVSIQNALDLAGPVHGRVLLPPSTPQISSTLNIQSSTILEGSSISGTQIQSYQYSSSGGTSFSGFMLSGIDVTNPNVRNISFRGPGLNGTSGSGITFNVATTSDVSGISMENVLVEEVPGTAIYLAHPVGSSLTNIKVLNFGGNGISTYLGTSVTFNSCYSLTGVGSGFLIKEGTYFSLNGCASETCGVDYDLLDSNNISISGCGSEVPIYRNSSEPGIHYRFNNSKGIVLNGCYAGDFSTAQTSAGTNQYINVTTNSIINFIGFRGTSSTNAPTDTYYIDGTSSVRFIDPVFAGLNATINSVLAGGSSSIISDSLSVLSGTTSGNIFWAMTEQGTFKTLKLYADAYENDTTTNQTITFPVAFSVNPLIVGNSTGLTITLTTTTLTITAPNTTTAYTGNIILMGS